MINYELNSTCNAKTVSRGKMKGSNHYRRGSKRKLRGREVWCRRIFVDDSEPSISAGGDLQAYHGVSFLNRLTSASMPPVLLRAPSSVNAHRLRSTAGKLEWRD